MLKFFGDHAINFEDNDQRAVEYYFISELRKIPIPYEIIEILQESLLTHCSNKAISKYASLQGWYPLVPTDVPGRHKIDMTGRILTMGPLGISMLLRPHYIDLPGLISDRIEWYSPYCKELVQAIRSYFYTVISHFGGKFALYTDNRNWNNLWEDDTIVNGSALVGFEHTLKAKYSKIKIAHFSLLFALFFVLLYQISYNNIVLCSLFIAHLYKIRYNINRSIE